MESVDKEFGSAMGSLFHQIITDMKVGAPLWEDFLSKASKLHTALKSTLSVIAAYLDAFQKIADSATNAKGATKDIGTVLTRICLRHKAVEARLKTFTSALMECLVLPLHDKLEEWKKMAINLDKEHAKEYKKVRADIKKRTAEAQRWQKKAKKIRAGMAGNGAGSMSSCNSSNNSGSSGQSGPGGMTTSTTTSANDRANQELLRAADAAQLDLNNRLALLQETEKTALKSALVEERSRYCLFVACLKPVMSEEMAMCAELSHLEEIIAQLDKHTADPFSLPSSTEQMIAELKGSSASEHGGNHWALQTPPSSPSSLGSRKSSMCSLGSIHSSSSGSVASHPPGQQPFNMQSPSHSVQQQQMLLLQQQQMRHRSLSQVAGAMSGGVGGGGGGSVRLSSVSSQDSGFTSQDTLVNLRPNSSPPSNLLTQQETVQFDRAPSGNMAVMNERPHTISTAYEKGHQRPALSVYTFQPLEHAASSTCSGSGSITSDKFDRNNSATPTSESPEYETLRRCRELKAGAMAGNGSQESLASRPPLPQRCSSLERPVVPPPPPSSTSSGGNTKDNNSNGKSGKSKDKSSSKKSSTLSLQQQQQQQRGMAAADDPSSSLPDFHQAAPDMIVPQPVYMNASELRQQQQNGEDPSAHAIYSSLAACSIYDDGQACRPAPPARPVLLRRPASFSGYADPNATQTDWSSMRGTGVRLSTIKRTSIPSFATLHEVSNVDESQLACSDDADVTPLAEMPGGSNGLISSMLPPPPDEVDLAALPPPPDFLLEESSNPPFPPPPPPEQQPIQGGMNAEPISIPERSLSVADAVKTLNEIRHQPASPGVVRRAQSLRATSSAASDPDPRTRPQQPLPPPPVMAKTGGRHSLQHHNHGHSHVQHHNHGGSNTLHHSSSMKQPPKMTAAQALGIKTLPRMPSSHHHDQHGTDQTDSAGQQNKLVSGLLSKSSFVHQLNAKLAQQHQTQAHLPGPPTGHHHPGGPGADPSASSSQRPAGGRPAVDHESLMDQIRRGTSLRRARSTSDRSSPHLKR